jgi:flagellar assembly factor FliW
MRIETKYFGPTEISTDDIIKFEQGIPGFPDEHAFVFLPLEETVFVIIQSIETAELAFITSSPFNFFSEYEFKLSDLVLDQLQIKEEKEVLVLVMMNVQQPFSSSTANLVAPIIVNTVKRMGRQVIIEKTSYKTKHKLPILEKVGE